MRSAIVLALIAACGGGGTAVQVTPDAGPPDPHDRWMPAPGTSWQWQIQGTIDQSVDAAVFDLDVFDTPQATIDALHAAGKHVVCYFDTAYEPNRPDSAMLEPYRGDPIDGWPGQFWLDIRVKAVQDVMLARLDLAKQKQCDGVEPDDVDVTTNDTMLHITPAEQLAFIQMIAAAGHARGLAVALKNDLDQVAELVDLVDFAVNEQCFTYTECDTLAPFIAKHKAVFQTEYTAGDLAAKGATVCPGAIQRDFDTLIKHLDLGAERFSCR